MRHFLLLSSMAGLAGGCVNSLDGSDLTPASQGIEALCEAELVVTGTRVTPTGGAPDPGEGCLPAGTWTVTVQLAGASTCAAVPVAGSYTYEIAGTRRDTTIAAPGVVGTTRAAMHAGGNGECVGSFEHAWAAGDGTFHKVLLRPWSAEGSTVVQGRGTYELRDGQP